MKKIQAELRRDTKSDGLLVKLDDEIVVSDWVVQELEGGIVPSSLWATELLEHHLLDFMEDYREVVGDSEMSFLNDHMKTISIDKIDEMEVLFKGVINMREKDYMAIKNIAEI